MKVYCLRRGTVYNDPDHRHQVKMALAYQSAAEMLNYRVWHIGTIGGEKYFFLFNRNRGGWTEPKIL